MVKAGKPPLPVWLLGLVVGSSVFFGLVDVQTDDLQLGQVAAAAALLADDHLRDTHTWVLPAAAEGLQRAPVIHYRVQLDCRHGDLSSDGRERGQKDLWEGAWRTGNRR